MSTYRETGFPGSSVDKEFACNAGDRGSISKVKRQPSEWEKIIPNGTTEKELISKIYKQHM